MLLHMHARLLRPRSDAASAQGGRACRPDVRTMDKRQTDPAADWEIIIFSNACRCHQWNSEKGELLRIASLMSSEEAGLSAGSAELNRHIKQVSQALEKVDRMFGLKMQVVVIGYHMVGRCASLRSQRRVITHIIAAYRKGRATANVEQMLMRGAGKTRQV